MEFKLKIANNIKYSIIRASIFLLLFHIRKKYMHKPVSSLCWLGSQAFIWTSYGVFWLGYSLTLNWCSAFLHTTYSLGFGLWASFLGVDSSRFDFKLKHVTPEISSSIQVVSKNKTSIIRAHSHSRHKYEKLSSMFVVWCLTVLALVVFDLNTPSWSRKCSVYKLTGSYRKLYF